MKIGIIGGSGLSESKTERDSINLDTPFGKPSAPYEIKIMNGQEIFFLKRHGEGHTIPPHRVNYRANIHGFKELNVDRIFGVFAVGSLDEELSPGSIVLPDQLIDLTQGMRENTFYDGPKVVHIDFTNPFCEEMRHYLNETADKMAIPILNRATYICIQGPRLETAAEIKLFKKMGAQIIGMTLMPEAALARELEICYCPIAVVVNYAAGITKNPLTIKEVLDIMKKSIDKVSLILNETIKTLPYERNCFCKDALKDVSF